MTNEEFLAAFEPLVGAPGGIKRLRGIILDLAFRGRLADACSDSGDEVCVHTRQDRLRVARELGVRVPQDLPPVRPEEVPFLVPAHWAWERIGNLGVVVGGATPNSQRSDFFAGSEGIPWITPADMSRQSNRLVSGGKRFLSDLGLASCSATLMPAGTILFSSRAPVGHVGIAACPIATNQGFKSLVPSNGMRSEFLYYAFRWALPMFESVASGTTFLEVSGAVFAKVILPIPPLAEQERIVERVDELMVLCDALEAEQAHAESLRTATAKSAFSVLVESALTDPTRAQRVLSEHLDAVLEPGSNAVKVVDELRKTILDLAVRGRLAPDTGTDGWDEVTLSDVVEDISAGWSPACDSEPPKSGEWGVLKISSISTGEFRAGEAKRLRIGLAPRPELGVRAGDVLVARASGSADLVGVSAHVLRDYPYLMISDKHLRLTFGPKMNPEYFQIWNLSSSGRAQLEDISSGATTTMKNVSQKMLLSMALLLPPIAEQVHIVHCVHQLLALLGDLETAFLEERALANALGESVASDLRTRSSVLAPSGVTRTRE